MIRILLIKGNGKNINSSSRIGWVKKVLKHGLSSSKKTKKEIWVKFIFMVILIGTLVLPWTFWFIPLQSMGPSE